MAATIKQFFCRDDNYGVLLHDVETGATAAIDVPDAAATLAALAETGWRLSDILVTHKHGDHIEGIPAVVEKTGARVTAPAKARAELPHADRYVGEGDAVTVGTLTAVVWETPGHCADHLAYYFAGEALVFAGDTVFAMGCGRVFGEDYAGMWASLQRFLALPDATTLYCGHEYTLANAKFARHAEPDNAALAARSLEVERLRAAGAPTLPTTIGLEKATNPFLRAGSLERFTALRLAKNSFR